MIVARRLLKSTFTPLFSAVTRTASNEITRSIENIKARLMNTVQQLKPNMMKSEASVLDVVDTFKCVNYRYEFPQNLTEEQKKHMKRFDIFR